MKCMVDRYEDKKNENSLCSQDRLIGNQAFGAWTGVRVTGRVPQSIFGSETPVPRTYKLSMSNFGAC